MQNRVAGDVTSAVGRALELALQRPELAAVVIVGSILALGAGLYLWRRLTRTNGDRFVAALSDLEEISVLMHPNPDPDSMASAMGVATLAEAVDTDATIQYAGQIRHSENRAFETVLDCDFERIVTDIDIASKHVVLVDHNEPRGFPGAEGIAPYAVVDHHPGDGEGEVFTDVRPDRGSCAGILAEYLRQQGYEATDPERPLSPRLATALLYGIQSDTTSFTRGCTPAEFDAAAFLFSAADADALERIANPQVDGETLDVKARAIQHRTVDGSFLVSHVGQISNTDALPSAVEELVRLEGVTAAVVTGERNGTLHASGRSRDDRVHMGNAIDAAFEEFPDHSAGGHARMGGGQVPLPDGGTVGLPEAPDSEAPQELEQRLFAAMNGEI